jgi:hypothetical protein
MNRQPLARVFGFETYMERTLEYMPMSVRMKLDLCGFRLSLTQWCGLPLPVRRTVLDMDCEAPEERLRLRRYLESTAGALGLGELTPLQCDPQAWSANSRVPAELVSAMNALGLPRPGREAWAGLSNLQRFALTRLTGAGRERKLRAALQEFGLDQEGKDREAQVFACLAKALAEGPHREFVREIDRSA